MASWKRCSTTSANDATFDFRGYKRASLTRRIFKRMQDRPAARDRAGDMGLSQWWRIRLWSCA
jgi:hypothetical protein